jgi:hypothetical protein
MLRKERTKEHVQGRPKDHTSNMQTEESGEAPKRRNSASWRKDAETPERRNSASRQKNAETPNSRNSATCSKTSGIRLERKTSENLDIRKNGENRRPIQNRILEQMSSAERRTSGPRRRARIRGGYGSDADGAWSREGPKPKARRASS